MTADQQQEPKWATRTGTVQVARWSVGTCSRCSAPLLRGEEIVRVTLGWIHVNCWRGTRRVNAGDTVDK